MVSLRCKLMVQSELKKMGIDFERVELGYVEIKTPLNEHENYIFKKCLLKSGLELLDDKKTILIEKIKNLIIELIHHSEDFPQMKFSDILSKKLGYDYTYLSNTFSEIQGITIQHYIILNKIEKVKEYLLYDELNITEISYKLNYSSVAHLSNQFKKITGLTPSFYKQLKGRRLKNLENL